MHQSVRPKNPNGGVDNVHASYRNWPSGICPTGVARFEYDDGGDRQLCGVSHPSHDDGDVVDVVVPFEITAPGRVEEVTEAINIADRTRRGIIFLDPLFPPVETSEGPRMCLCPASQVPNGAAAGGHR